MDRVGREKSARPIVLPVQVFFGSVALPASEIPFGKPRYVESHAVAPAACEADVGAAYFARRGSPVTLSVSTKRFEIRWSSRVPAQPVQLPQSGLVIVPPGHVMNALSALLVITGPARALISSAFDFAGSAWLMRS